MSYAVIELWRRENRMREGRKVRNKIFTLKKWTQNKRKRHNVGNIFDIFFMRSRKNMLFVWSSRIPSSICFTPLESPPKITFIYIWETNLASELSVARGLMIFASKVFIRHIERQNNKVSKRTKKSINLLERRRKNVNEINVLLTANRWYQMLTANLVEYNFQTTELNREILPKRKPILKSPKDIINCRSD